MSLTVSNDEKNLKENFLQSEWSCSKKKDTNGDILWTWSYPGVATAEKSIVLRKCSLQSELNNTFTFAFAKIGSNKWFYVLCTQVSESDIIPRIKQLTFVLFTREFNPQKYKALCRNLSTTYCKNRSTTELLQFYLSVFTGSACTLRDNSTNIRDDFDGQGESNNTNIKGLIKIFELKTILIYTAILLKKNIFVYHHSLEQLLQWIQTFPAIMKHRNLTDHLLPWIDLVHDELLHLKSYSYYIAGCTDSSIASQFELYDLLVNLPAREITVAPHAKECLTMTKTHKEIAMFMVQVTENQSSTESQVISDLSEKTRELLNQFISSATMTTAEEYSLNAVNTYGDSLLHIIAANGCIELMTKILVKSNDSVLNRKNKFGWTALMLAARNNKLQTVKMLLNHGANVNERTYLGISTLTLAAAMNQEMFGTLYKACPSALETAALDDITPLCVVAMKDDNKLFRHLINLNLKIENENTYTYFMMQQSVVTEMAALVEPHVTVGNYWNEPSENILIRNDRHRGIDIKTSITTPEDTTAVLPEFDQSNSSLSTLALRTQNSGRVNSTCFNLLSVNSCYKNASGTLISPNLNYNLDTWFIASPNLTYSPVYISRTRGTHSTPERMSARRSADTHCADIFVFDVLPKQPSTKEYFQTPDVNNVSFSLEVSPESEDDDDLRGENTPTPPHYRTPPRGTVLNFQEPKLTAVLKRLELDHLIPVFLAQEVDMDLFLTLTNEDLIEIGISNEAHRQTILSAISAYVHNDNIS